jgi:hypothetical protein
MLLTEQQAIAKVNQIVSQSGLGPEYRVYKVRAASWGWLMEWMPPAPDKALYGSSPYLIHKNGYVKELNDVAWRNRLGLGDIDAIALAFKREAETRILS